MLKGFADRFRKGAEALNAVLSAGANKELFEGACAAAAMVAMADGKCTDAESKAAIEVIAENRIIQGAGYDMGQIGAQFEKYLPKAARFSGRAELLKEITEAVKAAKESTQHEVKEFIFLLSLDVAASEDGIGDQEKTRLKEIASALGGFNTQPYGI